MHFVFEGTAHEFDLAAEQEFLLRHLSGRRKSWRCVLLASLAVLALAGVWTAMGGGAILLRLAAIAAAVLLLEQGWLDYSVSNMRGVLKTLYQGRRPHDVADTKRTLQLILETDGFRICGGGKELARWDCSTLCSASECGTVFSLCRRNGMAKTYLAIPKAALHEGDLDDFRAYLQSRLPEREHVRFYTIPQWMETRLEKIKAKI